jgi:hypothetical protein
MVKPIDHYRQLAKDAKPGTQCCRGIFHKGELLDPSEFGKHKFKKDGLYTQCRACRNYTDALSHEKNGTNKKKQDKERDFRIDEKRKQGVCQCGDTNFELFEFAHYERGTKYINKNGKCIGFAGLHIQQMKEELPKGRFLCPMCHRKETMEENKQLKRTYEEFETEAKQALLDSDRTKKCGGHFHRGDELLNPIRFSTNHNICKICDTYYQQERHRKGLEYINALKAAIGKCHHCFLPISEVYSYFEFDHIDPTTKCYNVAKMTSYNKVQIDAEIANCEMLCTPCHRRKTYKL